VTSSILFGKGDDVTCNKIRQVFANDPTRYHKLATTESTKLVDALADVGVCSSKGRFRQ
jgi:hypothetical protein